MWPNELKHHISFLLLAGKTNEFYFIYLLQDLKVLFEPISASMYLWKNVKIVRVRHKFHFFKKQSLQLFLSLYLLCAEEEKVGFISPNLGI